MEVFNEAVGMLGRKQQEGAIDSFDVCLLAPNGQLGGFMVIKGIRRADRGAALDEEFMRNTVDAELSVEGISHIEGCLQRGRRLADGDVRRKASSKVPQRA